MVQDVKVKVGNSDLDPIEDFDIPVAKGLGKNGIFSTVGQVVKLQYDVVTLPLNLLPAKTRRLAKQTVVDCFKTVRSLVDEVSDGVENILVTNLEKN